MLKWQGTETVRFRGSPPTLRSHPHTAGNVAESNPPVLIAKPRGLLSNAAWSVTALVITSVVAFITTPIVMNGVGIDNFGLYVLIGVIGSFVATLDVGMGDATLKYVSQHLGNNDMVSVNRVLGATLSVYVVAGLIGCVLVTTCAEAIVSLLGMDGTQVSLATRLVGYSGFAFLFHPCAGALRTIPEAAQRYDVSSAIRVALILVHGIALVLIVKLG